MQLTQKYDPHHDYFSHDGKDDNGGNRMATVLMYLEAAEEGGETVFPHVAVPANQTKEAGYSECAMQVGQGTQVPVVNGGWASVQGGYCSWREAVEGGQ
jgi:hypothetical protein